MTPVRSGHGDSLDLDEAVLVGRARGEFLEMPGLQLAPVQAARLWALDPVVSERVLGRLADMGFLWKRRDGSYIRVSGAR